MCAGSVRVCDGVRAVVCSRCLGRSQGMGYGLTDQDRYRFSTECPGQTADWDQQPYLRPVIDVWPCGTGTGQRRGTGAGFVHRPGPAL